MGLLSRVARVAGRVVAEVGGERGESLVEKARAVKAKVGTLRGRDGDPEVAEGPSWPGPVASVWSRGHDLLVVGWRDGSDDLLALWSEVGETIRTQWHGQVGTTAHTLQDVWRIEGEQFREVWDKFGLRLEAAWQKAYAAPNAVDAEAILDSAIQDGWRVVREGWLPVRLALKNALEKARDTSPIEAARWNSAITRVDDAWGHTEAVLSDRFRNAGSYMVSATREVAEGQAQPGEILEGIQRLTQGMDSAWKESVQKFRVAWDEGARDLGGQ